MERTEMVPATPWTETGNKPNAFLVPHPQQSHCTLVGLCCTTSVGSKEREGSRVPRRRQEAGEYGSGGG